MSGADLTINKLQHHLADLIERSAFRKSEEPQVALHEVYTNTEMHEGYQAPSFILSHFFCLPFFLSS